MSVSPQWSYVQARLHARHGERLQEGDWRLLEAARSVDQFIERARASSLRRFADPLNARMTSHAIERTLRATWRAYVAEVASWVPAEWRAAVLWTSQLPELPLIDVRAGASAPAVAARWMAHWRALWPRRAHDDGPLRDLAAAIAAQAGALERAAAQETSAPYRRDAGAHRDACVPPAQRRAGGGVLPSRACRY